MEVVVRVRWDEDREFEGRRARIWALYQDGQLDETAATCELLCVDLDELGAQPHHGAGRPPAGQVVESVTHAGKA